MEPIIIAVQIYHKSFSLYADFYKHKICNIFQNITLIWDIMIDNFSFPQMFIRLGLFLSRWIWWFLVTFFIFKISLQVSKPNLLTFGCPNLDQLGNYAQISNRDVHDWVWNFDIELEFCGVDCEPLWIYMLFFIEAFYWDVNV